MPTVSIRVYIFCFFSATNPIIVVIPYFFHIRVYTPYLYLLKSLSPLSVPLTSTSPAKMCNPPKGHIASKYYGTSTSVP